jgi:hypothetical protein
VNNARGLEFYVTPGPMTDLAACVDALEGLPDAPADLMKIVRGCVVSDLMLERIFELPVPQDRPDPQIRPAAAMVERIQELDPSPIVHARPPLSRFLGNCRHFATLSCALLRYMGIPARVRAGFAGYFEPNVWADHWIIEYWDQQDERWVRVDPQLDDDWLAKRFPGATSEGLAQSMYLSGGEAWQRCRTGELDPDRCNMGGSNWGIGEVRGSVMFDLAALNQDEMLPWDIWGRMQEAYRGETDAAYDELLDSISAVTSGDDFEAVRSAYRDDLRVPASLLPASV